VSDYPWLFNPVTFDAHRRVKPVTVIFGGIEAEAIKISGGVAAGVYVRMKKERITYSEYKGFDGEGARVHLQHGRLKCDVCPRFYEFPVFSGARFSFPFSPLPGWMVSNPSPLTPPGAEPQVLTVRVVCDRCSDLRDRVVRDLFEYGRVVGL